MKNLGWFILSFFFPVMTVLGADALPDKIDYNRDIRPILSNHCYACHGPDINKVEAGLQLNSAKAAYKELKSGERAIVPGDLLESALVYHIETDDADELMPPAKTNKGRSKSCTIALKCSWTTMTMMTRVQEVPRLAPVDRTTKAMKLKKT